MFNLSATSGPMKGKSWILKEEPLVIGRGTESDVSLSDSAPPGKHCEIYLNNDKIQVVPLNSLVPVTINGTPFNGGRVAAGDEIGIGPDAFIVSSQLNLGARMPSSNAKASDQFAEARIPASKLKRGLQLGGFKIRELLGVGGMGEVYRATDDKLGREVAIKILPEAASAQRERLAQFEDEAKALASLNHRNIASIHSYEHALLGKRQVYFFVMELIDGETLADQIARGPIQLETALRYFIQIADALEAAHNGGIIHCDLKPANVKVTNESKISVLDFGLSRSLKNVSRASIGWDSPQADIATAGRPTSSASFGTPSYMSPEQVERRELDNRADLWAFGCTFFEALSGTRAFEGASDSDTLRNVVEGSPDWTQLPDGLPESITTLLRQCLEKTPSSRPDGAGTIGDKLRDIRYALDPASQIRSLAVMPLRDLSANVDGQYFADGMTEMLIAELSKVEAIRVVSRAATLQLTDELKSPREAARKLNVDALVEGSVLTTENEVRITLQLVDSRSEKNLWAESYKEKLENVLALQGRVALAVVNGILIRITTEEERRLSSARPVSPEAHDAYLRGRFFWAKRTQEGLSQARTYFEKAKSIDPQFAHPCSGLADLYAVLGAYGYLPAAQAYPAAKREAENALALDDTLSNAHASLAYVKFIYEWDWKDAETEFVKAIELNPSYVTAHQWYAELLWSTRRFAKSHEQMEIALQIEPLGVAAKAMAGIVYYHEQRFDEAIERFKDVLTLDNNSILALATLTNAYLHIGQIDQARRTNERILEAYPEYAYGRGYKALIEAWEGNEVRTRDLLARLADDAEKEPWFAFIISLAYTRLGDLDQAFEWLDRTLFERVHEIAHLNVDPRWDALRKDERFERLLKERGFPIVVETDS